jgi:hypothetical protein
MKKSSLRSRRRHVDWALAFALIVVGCTRSSRNSSAPAAPVAARAAEPDEVTELVFEGGLRGGWQDWGWAPRETNGPGPARVHFANWGGWILAKPDLKPDGYGALVIRVRPPRGESEFLEVRVESGTQTTFPRIKVGPQHRADVGDGWVEVKLPMLELNPDNLPFDRIIIRAFRTMDDQVTLLDKIGFTKPDPNATAARLSPSAYSSDNSKAIAMGVACDAKAYKISPLIYGIAGASNDEHDEQQWKMGATIRRWGGNNTTRYNWELNVWNLDFDWFFENIKAPSYAKFLEDNGGHGVMSALTLPMIGWAAKDGTSSAFPVSVYGPQGKTDPYRPDAGDGTNRSGAKLTPGPPTRTSVPTGPDWVKRWVETIRAIDTKAGKRGVHQYLLDNEPMLWSTTHRDVRTEPLGYDELLQRTIDYGTAIREADPDAVIAGPAEWGWTNYFFSAKDTLAGFASKPDRRSHDDVPLVEWYLRKLREHDQKTGVRVLDVLDLHYYPQGENVYAGGGGGTDAQTAALRLRSTRSLWDPSYVDESWIKETVRLLPRMREWVDKNYPGRGISIGEWNFGGESHITGALSAAEALGRFAQFGVTSAYYWTHPPAGSPTLQGFLAFRSFDGKGGRFLDWYLPSKADEGASLFASRDEAGKHLVLVAINMSPDTAMLAKIDVGSCGPVASHQAFAYVRGGRNIAAGQLVQGGAPALEQVLPPWSITVIDVLLAQPMGGSIER